MTGLTFRPIARRDWPQLARWLAAPHVAQWWANDRPDIDWIEDNYGPVVDGTDPTRMFVIVRDGRDIGFIQCYRADDYPGYAASLAVSNGVGIDLYIGEQELVGRGIGTAVLCRFIDNVVKPHYPDQSCAVADPCEDNVASVRAFEKAGFHRGIRKPGDGCDVEQVMIRDL